MSARLAGHELVDEGAAYVRAGKWSRRLPNLGTSGVGRGKCSCGEFSDVLPSGNMRKAWHRAHKEEIRMDPEAAR